MDDGDAEHGAPRPAEGTGYEGAHEGTRHDRSDASESSTRSKGKRPREGRSSSARPQERAAENPGRRGLSASLGGPSRRLWSTASLGGPANPEGSSASLGGPPGDPEGSSASLGGPRQGEGNLDGPQDAPVQSNTSDGDDGYPSSSEESDVEAGPSLKRQRLCSSDGAGPSGLPCFDPASLVKSSEGTFEAPGVIRSYVDKHFRRCLSKEEREALFREHPKPDAESCSVPQVDKFITDFLGKNMPRDSEGVLCKIQAATLASARPLLSAWQNLLREGVQEEPDMMVPAAEVLAMIQRTLCLIGSASEQISRARRAKILEAIDPAWKKFSEDSFSSAKGTLFGEDFQSSLKDRVEKDTAISKAVAISKRGRKEPIPTTRKEGRRSNRFFRGGPPGRYGARQGRSFFPCSTSVQREQTPGFGRERQQFSVPRFGRKPLYHDPRLPQDRNNPLHQPPQRKP